MSLEFDTKSLFPYLEDEIGELDDSQKAFVGIRELLIDDKAFSKYRWSGNGRPPCARLALFKAFIQGVLESAHDVCGNLLARDGIAADVLTACTAKAIGRDGMFRVYHGSTAIDSRERGTKRLCGKRSWLLRDRRVLKQRSRDVDTNFAELPAVCDWGRKLNSKGRVFRWRGYKLRLPIGDGDIQLTVFLFSAILHDSQVAILLKQKTSWAFSYFHGLVDSADEANDILEESVALGQRLLVEANSRKDKVGHVGPGIPPVKSDGIGSRAVNIFPAEDIRYRIGIGVECAFPHLHDAHGGRAIRVCGSEKMFPHLMFGILVIAAEQIIKLLG